MKLEEILRQLPEEQIKWLVARRQLSLVVANFDDLHTVAHYLSRERNFSLAYSGLPTELDHLLAEIARQGGTTSVLGQRTRLQPLATEGLLFLLPPDHPQQAVIPDEYLFYLRRAERRGRAVTSPAERHDIIDCLQTLDDASILELAGRLLPEIQQEHPARMAAEIKAFFQERKNVDALLKQLSPAARKIFEHLLDCGGRVPLAALRAHFGDEIGPLFGYYSKASGEEKLSPLDELERCGLVFRLGRRHSCLLVVPYEIFDHFLRQILAQKEARRYELLKRARHEKVVPARIELAAAAIENEILKLLLAIRSVGLRATRRGGPHRQDLGRILRHFADSDMDRLAFLLALSTELGFLHLSLEGATIMPEAEHWYDDPDPKKVRLLFSTWLHMQLWDETRTATDFAAQPSPQGQHGSLVSSLRYLVRDALLQCPDNDWVSLRTFLLLCRQDADFDHMAYLLEAARHLTGEVTSRAWRAVSARPDDSSQTYEADADVVIEKMLRSLHYLALLDLGLDRAGRLEAIRKTTFGAAILRGEAPPAGRPVPSSGKITVQPNLDIIAPAGLPLHLHLALAAFCDVQSVGHAVVYHLSAKSLVRAVNTGQSLQELRRTLEEAATAPLPKTAELLFDSLAKRQGEIELAYVGGYLRVRDPYLLAELMSRQALDSVVAEEASETVVLLKPHVDLEKLQQSLRKKGYFVTLVRRPESRRKKPTL